MTIAATTDVLSAAVVYNVSSVPAIVGAPAVDGVPTVEYPFFHVVSTVLASTASDTFENHQQVSRSSEHAGERWSRKNKQKDRRSLGFLTSWKCTLGL